MTEIDRIEFDRSAPLDPMPIGGALSLAAVQVEAADYNGRAFDGSPFSASPEWLMEAVSEGAIAISRETRKGGFDYAVWDVKWYEYRREGDVKALAWPGDWIIRDPKGGLSVLSDAAYAALAKSVGRGQ